jgi:uroporphyrinogen decarboxylase
MTSRERVYAAVERTGGGRLPFYIMGFYEEEAQKRIQEHLGVCSQEEVSDRLGIDVRGVGGDWSNAPARLDAEGNTLDFWGAGGPPFTEAAHARPLQHAETVADVEAYAWPDPDWLSTPALDPQRYRYLSRHFVLLGGGPVWCRLANLMSMETLLVNMKLKPPVVEAAVERISDILYETTRRQLDAYDLVDGLHEWDDYATDTSLFFSIEDWRRFYKPALARLFDLMKSRGKLVWYHCCGAMSELLPELIDMGVDILEPCQVHLPGMSPERLKRDFGKDIVFYGGINTQQTLPFGTEEDVRREVRERVRVLGSDGGYIVGPDHSVNRDVPPENIVALYDEAAMCSSGTAI